METTRMDDVRKVVTTATEQARTSLFAALGAGNLAGQAVADTLAKARDRVNTSSETARKNIEELPTDLESLRERLDPAELRKLLDDYTESAWRLYHQLAESGEQTWERLSEQARMRRAIEQMEEALRAAQERVDDVAADAREHLDGMVARVARREEEAPVDTGVRNTERRDEPGPAAFDRAVADEVIGTEVAEGEMAGDKVAGETTTGPAATEHTESGTHRPGTGDKPQRPPHSGQSPNGTRGSTE